MTGNIKGTFAVHKKQQQKNKKAGENVTIPEKTTKQESKNREKKLRMEKRVREKNIEYARV